MLAVVHKYIHACICTFMHAYMRTYMAPYHYIPNHAYTGCLIVCLFVCLFACLFFCLLHGWLVYTRCLWTCIWWFLLKVYCSILLRTPADIWGSFVVMMAPCWKRWWTMRCSQLEDISSWPHLNLSMVFWLRYSRVSQWGILVLPHNWIILVRCYASNAVPAVPQWQATRRLPELAGMSVA